MGDEIDTSDSPTPRMRIIAVAYGVLESSVIGKGR
jgi:hypothetical protein